MKITKYISVAIMLMMTIVLSSCFKEDVPVVLPLPGDAENFQIGMGEDYHRQEYFDFNTTDTMGSNHDIWDLCFEASDSGWHVWMNGANESFIANTDTQDFEAVVDTTGANWLIDNPDWNLDSTAVGDWRIDRMVYLLDRGPSKLAGDRFKKMVFQAVDDTHYEIQFANLDGSGFIIYEIQKKPGQAYVYFSFDNGGSTLDIEPEELNWDILFTRYRYVFYSVDPPLPYIVTGVLINPGIAVAIDSTMIFSSIDYTKATSLTYTSKRDIIGFNWKYYDFTTQAYIVRPYVNFIIRDIEGVYWKFHFIDFYNTQGQKGYPQFEYQRL